MPLYFVLSVDTLRTVPTGSNAGSAAATPDRTTTPDAVVLPECGHLASLERPAEFGLVLDDAVARWT